MNVTEVINYWLSVAEADITAAQHLYEAGDYPQALFFGHLCLEKILKALVVQKTESHAPYSHNLLSLARKTGLELSAQIESDLDHITKYNLEVRYPENLLEIKQRYTRTYCEKELSKIKALVKWFKENIQP